MTTKGRIGSTLESFFDDIGERDELEVGVAKKILAFRASLLLERSGVTQVALAKRMGTSRTVVHRLLDEEDTGVTLETMVRAARALGVSLGELLGLAPMPGTRGKSVAPEPPTARPKQVRSRSTGAAYTGSRRARPPSGARRTTER